MKTVILEIEDEVDGHYKTVAEEQGQELEELLSEILLGNHIRDVLDEEEEVEDGALEERG